MGPCEAKLEEFVHRGPAGVQGVRGFVFGACGEVSPAVTAWIDELANMGAERGWREMGARDVLEARRLIKHAATMTLGIVAVRGNARLKLDRLGVAFGEAEGADERRANDRFGFDEMNRARRCQFRRRRAQRFNGPRAHSACSA